MAQFGVLGCRDREYIDQGNYGIALVADGRDGVAPRSVRAGLEG